MKLNIGIDIDGVLADLISATVELFNEKFNTNFTKQHCTGWDFFIKTGLVDREGQTKLFNESWTRNLVRLEEPEVGQILWDLKKQGHRVTIISHRHSDTIPVVVTWLQRNWIVYNNLVFLGNTENKLKYVDCLIDDHPRAAEKAIEYPNKTFYLRNQPWNQEDQGDNVIRVDSLEDFYGRITK